MIFGPTPLSEAVGAILAHSIKITTGIFKKGRRLSVEDIAALKAAGHTAVIAARLANDDVPEDEAARAISLAACGGGARAQEAFTGRANLYSSAMGLLVVDEARLRAFNHVHESLTIATLPSFSRVGTQQMVATIKVIPFAVPRDALQQALAIIGTEPLLRVAPFRPRDAALILTTLPQTKPNLLHKGEVVIRERLESMGATLGFVTPCEHAIEDVALAVVAAKDMGFHPILVMGASAIVDRADVIPAAVVAAGGDVTHLGMPVDPGNLLMLGELHGTPVIGVPSCARSPKVNGFDWVLERLMADLPVTPDIIMNMGAGGLLAEIPSRPSPREGKRNIASAPKVTAVVLAAGASSRMGANKMLAEFHGRPMIRATIQAIRRSSVDDIIAVLGHEAGAIDELADPEPISKYVRNPDFTKGISTSIRCGVKAAGETDAVLICLGDMPLVRPQTIDKLIAAYDPAEKRNIVVPTHKGRFGNPVLWGRKHFGRLLTLEGDRGARSLMTELADEIVEIEVDDPGILADADTPEDLARLRAAGASVNGTA